MSKKSHPDRWVKLTSDGAAKGRGGDHDLSKDTTAQANLFTVLLATFGVSVLATVFNAAMVLGEFDDVPFGKWGASVLVVPLDLLALLVIYNLFHQIVLAIRRKLGGVGVGRTAISLSKHPLRPGEHCRVRVSQAGDVSLRTLRVLLVCDVKEPEPTDKVNALPNPSKRIYGQELANKPGVRATPERPYEFTCDLTVPSEGVLSQDPYCVEENEDEVVPNDEELADPPSVAAASGLGPPVAGLFEAGNAVKSPASQRPATEEEIADTSNPYAGQEVTWKILVQGDIPAWPDFERAFRVEVEANS